mmetsp:Transcript_4967/g.6159  ORF Transcript_4967/g.6159 Transcript_4967/m.6159 type:complete len:98 (+) Transcript_4967:107-400(+)
MGPGVRAILGFGLCGVFLSWFGRPLLLLLMGMGPVVITIVGFGLCGVNMKILEMYSSTVASRYTSDPSAFLMRRLFLRTGRASISLTHLPTLAAIPL